MKFRVYIRCRASKKKKEKKKKKHVREVTISFDEEGEHSIYTHSRINVTGRRIVPVRQPHPILGDPTFFKTGLQTVSTSAKRN